MSAEGKRTSLARRRIVAALAALFAGVRAKPLASAQPAPGVGSTSSHVPFARTVPGRALRFPFDEGSHPDFRIEWWYVTGWLEGGGRPLGFQITFFRMRLNITGENPSAFTPRQLLAAHAALTDPAQGNLIHAQRVARPGFGLAGAESGRTHVWIGDWSLAEDRDGYAAAVDAAEFTLALRFRRTQPPLLHGEHGYSRKGPQPDAASYYYSVPQLDVGGTVTQSGRKKERVSGTAWLDHEWSSQYMDKRAVGWDWLAVNFDDGSALMAFRMRAKAGGSVWAGGTYRNAVGAVNVFGPDAVDIAPRREWRSPRTGATYPVSVSVRAGTLKLEIEPLIDDQESDTRASTGTVYWEGAVRAVRGSRVVGRGYLELTGYWRPLSL